MRHIRRRCRTSCLSWNIVEDIPMMVLGFVDLGPAPNGSTCGARALTRALRIIVPLLIIRLVSSLANLQSLYRVMTLRRALRLPRLSDVFTVLYYTYMHYAKAGRGKMKIRRKKKKKSSTPLLTRANIKRGDNKRAVRG